MRYNYFAILFLVLRISLLHAQDDNSIDIISVSQGLPNSQITELYQGAKGLLWVGTKNGLCVYNGHNFSVKQSTPFDTTTFADDDIISLTQDINNNIWLLTQYGIEFLNTTTGEVKRVLHLTDISDEIRVHSSKTDSLIYISLLNRVTIININDFKSSTVDLHIQEPVESSLMRQNTLYLLGNKHMYTINDEQPIDSIRLKPSLTGKIADIQIGEESRFAVTVVSEKLFRLDLSTGEQAEIFSFNEKIVSLSTIHENTLGVATQHAVYQVLLDDDYSNISILNSAKLESFTILNVLLDKEYLMWIATDRGIVKYNPHSKKIVHTTEIDKINTLVRDVEIIAESTRQGIIYKTRNKDYYFCFSRDNTYYPLRNMLYTSSCLLDERSLLLGTADGLYRFDLSNSELDTIGDFNGQKIHAIAVLNDVIWVSSSEGLFRSNSNGFTKICDLQVLNFIVTESELYVITHEGFGILNYSGCNPEILLTESSAQEFVRILDFLESYDGKIWLATDDGLYKFNSRPADAKEDYFTLVFKGKVYSLLESASLPEVWFATDLGIGSVNYQTGQVLFLGYEDGLRQTAFIPKGAYASANGKLNYISKNELISFYPDSIFRNLSTPDVEITEINYFKKEGNGKKLFLEDDTITIDISIKNIEIVLSTLDFYAPVHTTYFYSLEKAGTPDNFKTLTGSFLSIGSISPGKYILKFKAVNSHGVQSRKIKSIVLIVKTPWFETKLAYAGYIFVLAFLIFLLLRVRTRSLRKINREYRDKERIARQIEIQKEELTLKNKNITDSINYARRIQVAMMPSAKVFKTHFPDSFILHMPKDIVSGDFYWVNKVNNKVFFSAVDCTGHGVPGAFMSIIGVELFRRITEIEKISTPAEILNSLSNNFDRVFGDVDEMKLRDGMDLAFCSINADQTLLEYAGAFNPLYIVRDSSIIEIKADRQSVGLFDEEDINRSFNNHVIPLQDGDIIYIFTDGFADQFGGPDGKKYKYRRFRHLLLALHQLPLEKQEEFLKRSIIEWRGETDQVDDILVMGIRINHLH